MENKLFLKKYSANCELGGDFILIKKCSICIKNVVYISKM